MKKLFLSFVFVSLALFSFSQRENLEKGDDFFRRKMYTEAIEYYKKALSEDVVVNKFYMTQQVAKTYKHLLDYKNAAEWYEKLMTFKDENSAENFKEYADLLMVLEKYDEAFTIYKQYADKVQRPELVSYYEKKCKWPAQNQNLAHKYALVKTNIETGGKGLGIAFYNDGLLMATPQTAPEVGKTLYYDLAFSKRTDSASFALAEKLNGTVNKDFYEAAPCISPDGNFLYYTSNASTKTSYKLNPKKETTFGKKGLNVLKIYRAENVKGTWTNEKELPFNGPDHSCAFPFVSADGKTLYFASDMNGTKGGFDIYQAPITEGGNIGSPVNLSEINTIEDEFYPFVQGEAIYFSSRGLPGFGGADIFKSTLKNGAVGIPQNMGKPFNSPKDDFTFIMDANGKEGFFTSNREGENGLDLVYFFRKPIEWDTLRGTVLDAITSKPVAGAKVELFMVDPKTGDTLLINTKMTPKDGKWDFKVHPERTYKVRITMPGYTDYAIVVPPTDSKKYEDGNFDKTRAEVEAKLDPLKLQPKVEKDNVVRIDNIYFDFDKATLKSESLPILDNLYNFLIENPNARIELSAHTDAVGKDAYNLKLSSSRAQSCFDYLVTKGIDKTRMIPKGYGETKLLNNCKQLKDCPDDQHAINRRVEVKFL
jgi:outer membrane protein OmpA-like peptidoglycan-associated protein/tetratricopeptide (TPR) repeat protein